MPRQQFTPCPAIDAGQRCIFPHGIDGHPHRRRQIHTGLGLPQLVHQAADGHQWVTR